MKTLIASALMATAAMATVASASTSTALIESEASRYVTNADVSNLTPTQLQRLALILHSGDDEGEKRAAVRSILK